MSYAVPFLPFHIDAIITVFLIVFASNILGYLAALTSSLLPGIFAFAPYFAPSALHAVVVVAQPTPHIDPSAIAIVFISAAITLTAKASAYFLIMQMIALLLWHIY